MIHKQVLHTKMIDAIVSIPSHMSGQVRSGQ
jgi:hypothetical protein